MKIIECHNSFCSELLNKLKITANIVISEKGYVNIAIATGDTFKNFLREFFLLKDFPFAKTNLYVVDEYAGISPEDRRSCTNDIIDYAGKAIYKLKSFCSFPEKGYEDTIEQYNNRLKQDGLDICILGIGIDGHVGFNYPQIENVDEKYFTLQSFSRTYAKEHVKRGWFPTLQEVPTSVITLTLWGMMQSQIIFLGAFHEKKAGIIKHILDRDLDYRVCPIQYLMDHKEITLYVEYENSCE